LTATVCQSSYPLNSENASPFGTCTVYLSCAARAMPTKPARTTEPIAIALTRTVEMRDMGALRVWGQKSPRGEELQPPATIEANERRAAIGPWSNCRREQAPCPSWPQSATSNAKSYMATGFTFLFRQTQRWDYGRSALHRP